MPAHPERWIDNRYRSLGGPLPEAVLKAVEQAWVDVKAVATHYAAS